MPEFNPLVNGGNGQALRAGCQGCLGYGNCPVPVTVSLNNGVEGLVWLQMTLHFPHIVLNCIEINYRHCWAVFTGL